MFNIKEIVSDRLTSFHLFTLVIVFLLIGTVFFAHIEGWRYVDAFYFSAITLSTVGYGDLAPKTDLGKIFTVFYLLLGIGLIFSFINSITQSEIKRFIRKKHK